MAGSYQVSAVRPHLNVLPSDELDGLQDPTTTFTALLNAAQSVEVDTATASSVGDVAPAPGSSADKRRLRNRESCRKTRLKRKLQQHALDLLVRDRKERQQYLRRLSCELEANNAREHQSSRDELYRDFAVRSLHYSLVDPECSDWRGGKDARVLAGVTTKRKRESQAAPPKTRKSKRLRTARAQDTSPAGSASDTPQDSLLDQWRPIVDGLQNVDLKIHSTDESDLGAGVFERRCHWKLVGLSSSKIQRDGAIAAVAVAGTTGVRFLGNQVQEINLCNVRRQDNVPFDLDAARSTVDGGDGSTCPSSPDA
jgi:hypothetical protein